MATKSMALELAEYNIRVNAIAPGIVNTRLFESRWFDTGEAEKEKQKAQQAGIVPLRRIADPEDMVGALIYLASDGASYTTGETILIDGGMLLKQAREVLEDGIDKED
jgi:meso-butanediol dehydrogenase/(S,S)-butanediol dehydrogenase/diacetyl reductase